MADTAAILDFWSERFQLFLIYKSLQCLPSVTSNGLLNQEKKQKIHFHGGVLEFPIGTILANFVLQFTSMLPTKSQAD